MTRGFVVALLLGAVTLESTGCSSHHTVVRGQTPDEGAYPPPRARAAKVATQEQAPSAGEASNAEAVTPSLPVAAKRAAPSCSTVKRISIRHRLRWKNSMLRRRVRSGSLLAEEGAKEGLRYAKVGLAWTAILSGIGVLWYFADSLELDPTAWPHRPATKSGAHVW
ncbi:MAG TPA: hypothetical protein VGY53_04385 [Isosphaeraceae bacterium]|nr:hypothetical protein [Isosphaeraceae bacterium]